MLYNLIKNPLLIMSSFISLFFYSCINDIKESNVDLKDCAVEMISINEIIEGQETEVYVDVHDIGEDFVFPDEYGPLKEGQFIGGSILLTDKGEDLFNSLNFGEFSADKQEECDRVFRGLLFFYQAVVLVGNNITVKHKLDNMDNQSFRNFVLLALENNLCKEEEMGVVEINALYSAIINFV